jgi:iron complex transport system substrate-binding protein
MIHPPKRTLLGTSLLIATLFAVSGCASSTSATAPSASEASGYPVTVSSCGVSHTYTSAPQRVLLGAPGIVDTLDALGVADSAMGYALSDLDEGEAAAHPALTNNTSDWTPAKEYLLGADPDLFIANDEQQFTGDGAASLADLETVGAGLYVLGDYCADSTAKPSIDAVYNDIDSLGTIYNVPDKAKTLNDQLRSRVDAAAALNHGGPVTAASVSIVDGTVYALTGAGYEAVLDSLGITNAFAGVGANYTQISREDVITADPDIIFVTYSGPDDKATAIANATSLFAGSKAVTDGKVFGQDENAYQAGGIRIVDVVEQSAKDAFGSE